jgi:DtxR family Mn-dependent transcriptional regulator
MVHKKEDNRRDELMEILWRLGEQGEPTFEQVKENYPPEGYGTVLDELTSDGLVKRSGENISLTDKGKDFAYGIIRRHRLAERLVVDILGEEGMEKAACEFEHVLAPEITDAICTLLGHPRTCPHDKPIPEGKCCAEARDKLESAVIPLSKLKPGKTAKVASINTRDETRMLKLMTMGITPGARIHLRQKRPAFVIDIGDSQLALDRSLAEKINVWRPENG